MNYVLNLSQAEINIIQMGIGELPLKIGINLLGKLQQEVSLQDAKNAVSMEDLVDSAT